MFLEHGETLGAIPLAARLLLQGHAGEVEPLDGTVLVVAADHLPVAHLLAQAVGRLVRINWNSSVTASTPISSRL